MFSFFKSLQVSFFPIFQGILGFYKGISASYMGISETVVHFVLYEGVKARLIEANRRRAIASGDVTHNPDRKQPKDFIEFMAAGAFSKTVASCIAYPHGKNIFSLINTLEIFIFLNVFF